MVISRRQSKVLIHLKHRCEGLLSHPKRRIQEGAQKLRIDPSKKYRQFKARRMYAQMLKTDAVNGVKK